MTTTVKKKHAPRKKAAAKPAPTLKQLMAKATPEEIQAALPDGADGEKLILVPLKPRHFEYLQRAAVIEGRTITNQIDRFVRIHYANDPTKAGLISPETDHGYSGVAKRHG